MLVREVAGSDPKPEACRRELNVTPSEPGKDVAIGEYAKLLPTMTAFLKRSGKHALGVAAIGNPEKSLGRGARVRGRNLFLARSARTESAALGNRHRQLY